MTLLIAAYRQFSLIADYSPIYSSFDKREVSAGSLTLIHSRHSSILPHSSHLHRVAFFSWCAENILLFLSSHPTSNSNNRYYTKICQIIYKFSDTANVQVSTNQINCRKDRKSDEICSASATSTSKYMTAYITQHIANKRPSKMFRQYEYEEKRRNGMEEEVCGKRNASW